VKFTDKGSIEIVASAIETDTPSPKLRIEVKDTGIGIAADRLDMIFQQFAQADTSTARKYGGTGLGLSISSELARLMAGELTVARRESEGTTFTLTLPLVEADSGQIPAAVEWAATPAPALGSPRNPRVLIAEDFDINQILILSMAERAGLDADIAADGEEAVSMTIRAAAEGRPYQLILMDMQMPRLDGIEATRKLRAAGYSPEHLPIVALTANAYAEDVKACLAAGMQAHLSKPIRLRDLANIAARWIAPEALPEAAGR